MSDKDVNLTMDTKTLVRQVLSTLPPMGNQVNVINIQSVYQEGIGEVESKMFCFDLEFEKFFEMLPHPRLKSLIDFCYQLAMKKFNGNTFLSSRYVGVTQKTIYNFLKKDDGVLKEITSDSTKPESG